MAAPKGPWGKKDGESDEEHAARTGALKQKLRDRLNSMRGEQKERAPKSAAGGEAAPEVNKTALTQTLDMVNGMIRMFSPADALTKDEGTMLVEATLRQQKASKTFRKYLSRFVGAAGATSFFGAVALIVYVRLERRNIVPSLSGMPGMPQPAPAPGEDGAGGADFWQQQEFARNHPDAEGVVAG